MLHWYTHRTLDTHPQVSQTHRHMEPGALRTLHRPRELTGPANSLTQGDTHTHHTTPSMPVLSALTASPQPVLVESSLFDCNSDPQTHTQIHQFSKYQFLHTDTCVCLSVSFSSSYSPSSFTGSCLLPVHAPLHVYMQSAHHLSR